MVKLGLNLSFGGTDRSGGLKREMQTALRALSEDTLYVLNRSCSNWMTNEKLDELFAKYYEHSAYRLISEAEIETLSKKKGDHFFALVGELFGGESEPESTGIYLLDRSFELCDFPYPVLTTYRDPMGAPCFANQSISAQTIMTFNRKLKNRS